MDRIVITGGHLLTMEPGETDGIGDILVEDGRITRVGAIGTFGDAEIVDARGRIVIPGLIDSHRHLWQAPMRDVAAQWSLSQYFAEVHGRLGPAYSPEDAYNGDLLGAREALWAGVTTVLDFNQVAHSSEHADAALDGLRDSGIRAVYAPALADRASHELDRLARSAGGLVAVASATRSAEASSPEIAVADLEAARMAGVRAVSHVGGGLRGKQIRSIDVLAERDLLGPDVMVIHASMSSDAELRSLADAGAHASVSPRIEMLMGHGMPATGRLVAAGILPSLSVDVVTGVTGDLLADARAALEVEMLQRNLAALADGRDGPSHELTSLDALRWATLGGARALGLDDRVGSLAPGKDADIVVLDVRTPAFTPLGDAAAAATRCGPRDVEHVLVGGRFRKRDFALVGVDAEVDAELARSTRARIFRAAGVPHG